MNTKKRLMLMLLALSPLLALGASAIAGQIVSVGAGVDDDTGSVQNVGQTCISVVESNGKRMYVGGLYTLHSVTCLKGDVDLNGLINGADIDEFLMAYIDGIGSPTQLCAADLEVEEFVALLLAQ